MTIGMAALVTAIMLTALFLGLALLIEYGDARTPGSEENPGYLFRGEPLRIAASPLSAEDLVRELEAAMIDTVWLNDSLFVEFDYRRCETVMDDILIPCAIKKGRRQEAESSIAE